MALLFEMMILVLWELFSNLCHWNWKKETDLKTQVGGDHKIENCFFLFGAKCEILNNETYNLKLWGQIASINTLKGTNERIDILKG